jgi:hypothetical protein
MLKNATGDPHFERSENRWPSVRFWRGKSLFRKAGKKEGFLVAALLEMTGCQIFQHPAI